MKININPHTYRNLVVAFLLMFAASSCNDWIDIEPENDLTQEEFWKTKDDVLSVLAASYDALRNVTEKSFLLGEVRADFIYNLPSVYSDYNRIGQNDITLTNDKVKWGDYYKIINLANTVMYYAPIVQELDQTLTDKELKGIEAEMIFIRSLSYFYMVRIWKDVPLVMSPTISDTVDFYKPKSDEKIVLNRLIADLKYASALASTDATIKGRGNKYAIQALLADIYLWNQNYNQCRAYCDSIINTGKYALESNTDWFNLYYPGNSMIESIFEIQYDDNLEGQENPMYTNLYNELRVDVAVIAFDRQNDIRYCKGRAPIWKYRGKDETATLQRTASERDVNFIYYRYADVLLMKAEALAELGSFEDANYLVRQVAERAGVTHNYVYAIQNFRAALLTERGREFCGEGKRWFDVLRFAKRNQFENKKLVMDIILSKADNAQELAIMRTKVLDTMSYYLPIHLDEILYNKNLKQNSFYER